MTEVVSSYDDAIADLVGVIHSARDQKAAELAEAEERVKGLKAELQRIDRIIRAAEPPAPASPKSTPNPSRKKTVSEERKQAILDILSASKDGLTAVQIAEEMDVPAGSVTLAIQVMREEELVRNAGVAANGPGRAPTIWKAMPQ